MHPTFIAVLFTRAKTWSNLWPSADEEDVVYVI